MKKLSICYDVIILSTALGLYLSVQTHIYLHSYCTTATMPLIFQYKHTYIYIHTVQQLRYPMEALEFFAYIHGAIWTMRQLADTMAFNRSLATWST